MGDRAKLLRSSMWRASRRVTRRGGITYVAEKSLNPIDPAHNQNGWGGIRTPGTFRYSGFQDRRNRPLCHPSRIGKHRVFESRPPYLKLCLVLLYSMGCMGVVFPIPKRCGIEFHKPIF